MTVRNIVSVQKLKKPPFCHPDTTMFDSAVKIAELNVNALAAVENGDLVGIITDHDIIRAIADGYPEFPKQTVRGWMTTKVITYELDAKLTDALKLMASNGIRHLVVLEGGKPVTVFGSRELLTRIHEHDELEISVLRDLARIAQASQIA